MRRGELRRSPDARARCLGPRSQACARTSARARTRAVRCCRRPCCAATLASNAPAVSCSGSGG
eukprot:6185493-Pleurochrysis_carterae.AAC.3